jgi:hypothetical protein
MALSIVENASFFPFLTTLFQLPQLLKAFISLSCKDLTLAVRDVPCFGVVSYCTFEPRNHLKLVKKLNDGFADHIRTS